MTTNVLVKKGSMETNSRLCWNDMLRQSIAVFLPFHRCVHIFEIEFETLRTNIGIKGKNLKLEINTGQHVVIRIFKRLYDVDTNCTLHTG